MYATNRQDPARVSCWSWVCGGRPGALRFEKVQNQRVELAAMGRGKPVRCPPDDLEPAPLDHGGGAPPRDLQRNDAVGVAVHDEHRHRDLVQILSEVRGPERNNALLRT